jgi:hypothetical protein
MEQVKAALSHLRVGIKHNPHYKRSGTASYLHAARKFKFNPPFCLNRFVNS